VEIDFCPDCRGVWLDCGELGEVVDHTDAQFLRVALDVEAEALRSTIAAHSATLDDFITDREAREHASMARARAVEALNAVEHALTRLGDGSYGICVTCREPIAAARLEAVPSTEHCIRCVAG
jgi:RNA polymerase-binding transcription factor DksA